MFSSHKKYSEEVWGVNSTFKPFHVIDYIIFWWKYNNTRGFQKEANGMKSVKITAVKTKVKIKLVIFEKTFGFRKTSDFQSFHRGLHGLSASPFTT